MARTNDIRCDLCGHSVPEAATLSVPKAWTDSELAGKLKGRERKPEHGLLFFVLSESSSKDFDICHGCVSGLLRTKLWLQGVMQEMGR